jgi:hypothetical protein
MKNESSTKRKGRTQILPPGENLKYRSEIGPKIIYHANEKQRKKICL